ncbi:MAG: hypothetical protein K1X83_15800 [Oligoflexia bacterium]|nr:hypothetical protein [Oligoflexia bacterium]
MKLGMRLRVATCSALLALGIHALLMFPGALVVADAGADDRTELRIADRVGLVRFSAHIEGPQTLEIRFSGVAEPIDAVLTHADGLSPPIRGQQVDAGVLRFPRVSPGTWHIAFYQRGTSTEDTKIRLESVQVVH